MRSVRQVLATIMIGLLAAPVVATDDTTTPDLLPGVDLVTEEVEPGVYRVLSDGVRDLHAPPPAAMVVGQDGQVWMTKAGRLVKLGESGEHVFSTGSWASELDMAVDAAGTFWGTHDLDLDDPDYRQGLTEASEQRLTSFDGSDWTLHDWPDAFNPERFRVEASPDGSVLVVSGDRVARVRDGEWTFLPSWAEVARAETGVLPLVATDDTVWLGCSRHWRAQEAPCEGLLRFDGTAWDVVRPVPERPGLQVRQLAAGPDGTLWVYLSEDLDDDDRFLARLQDDRWSVFSAEDGVPMLISWMEWDTDLSVDADGTLWMATNMDWDYPGHSVTGSLPSPHGVASFDGTTWRQYLADPVVQQVEAVGGQVWVLGDGFGNFGRSTLYVITPEAVAAE